MGHRGTHGRRRQGGQAIVLVTLALFAMCGMMGLSVDVGWSYYTQKFQRAAADGAALAAVRAALGGGTCNPGSTNCVLASGTPWTSASAGDPCSMHSGSASSTDPFVVGCNYAANNGFTDGQGNASVFIASGSGTPPTVAQQQCAGSACSVSDFFYVTMTVQNTVPQLFSAILGHPTALVAARATAVIANEALRAQFTLTNRVNDPQPPTTGDHPWTGSVNTDICIGGKIGGGCSQGSSGSHVNLYVPGGMAIASTSGSAGIINGGSTTQGPNGNTPFTFILQENGSASSVSGGGTWVNPPKPAGDGPQFRDPKAGVGQPPLPTTSLINTGNNADGSWSAGGVAGGASENNPRMMPAGNYYTDDPITGLPKGQPMYLSSGYFQFGDSGSFGTFVFYGGLIIAPGVQVQFGPGVYVFAGVSTTGFKTSPALQAGPLAVSNPCSYSGGAVCPYILMGPVNNNTPTVMEDLIDPNQSLDIPSLTNPGELFIFTDAVNNRFGLNIPSALGTSTTGVASTLNYGTAGVCLAADVCDDDSALNGNPTIFIGLHGLNNGVGDWKTSYPVLANNFNGFLWWQDQGNSYVAYNSQGNLDFSCGTGKNIDNSCPTALATNMSFSPEMDIPLGSTGQFCGGGSTGCSGKVEVDVWGAIYQPRGAWLQINMKGSSAGGQQYDTLTVVTGALAFQSHANGNLLLNGIGGFVTTLSTGLVE